MGAPVSAERSSVGWTCEAQEGGLRARVLLADVNGRLSVTEVRVTSATAGGDLNASALSAAPYARWFRAAHDAVIRKERVTWWRDDHAEVRPFLEDRRGKPPRSDEDYANLALLYVLRGPDTARILAAEYGRSVQTWRNHLTKAKRFIHMVERRDRDGDVRLVPELTDEAHQLVYRDHPDPWEDEEALSEYQYALNFLRAMENPQTPEDHDMRELILRDESPEEIEQILVQSKQIVAAGEE